MTSGFEFRWDFPEKPIGSGPFPANTAFQAFLLLREAKNFVFFFKLDVFSEIMHLSDGLYGSGAFNVLCAFKSSCLHPELLE